MKQVDIPEREVQSRMLVRLVIAACLLLCLLNAVGFDLGKLAAPGRVAGSAAGRSWIDDRAHLMLELVTLCAAIGTAILGLIHFYARRDAFALILSVALLGAGYLGALHTFLPDDTASGPGGGHLSDFTWILSQTLHAGIVIFCALRFLGRGTVTRRSATYLFVLVAALCAIATHVILLCARDGIGPPRMIFPTASIPRPYDLVPLAMFASGAVALALRLPAERPSMFCNALLMGKLPQVMAQLYMALGCRGDLEASFYAAHALRLIAYLVPFAGLCFDYLSTSRDERRNFERLRQAQLGVEAEKRKLESANAALRDEIERRVQAEDDKLQLRDALENAVEAIARLSPDGRYRSANSSFADLLGYDPSDLVGMSWEDTIVPEERPRVRDAIREMLRTGKARTETIGLRRDGSTFHAALVLIAAVDRARNNVGLYCFTSDITARKVSEQTVRESEARIRASLESVVEGVITVDEHGTIEFMNRAVERLFGYEAREVIGASIAALLRGPDGEQPIDAAVQLRQLLDGGGGGELWGVRRDRSRFPARVSISEVPVGGRRLFTGIVRDISDLKRAEADLRAVEARNAATLQCALDCVITMDHRGLITQFNRAAEQTFGYRAADVLGNELAETIIPPELREEHRRGLTHHDPSAESRLIDRRIETRGMRADGSEFPIELAVTRLPVEGPPMFTAFLRDITERRQAEEQLARAASETARVNEDLRRRNKELDEFTYVASHDLQEPLRKLTAFSGLLSVDAGDELPDRAKEDLSFITDAATRMQRLVGDLLALSRAGRTEMQLSNVAIDECVESAIEALSLTIGEKHAEIQRDPLPVVFGDRTLLTQLYQNLIGNALKFCDKSHPVIHITAEHSADGLVLGVEDNGIGIKREYQETIFKPFKRLHGRDEYEGSGIGLAICRKAAERHGGRIWVESKPGVGSHFRFTLPHAMQQSTAELATTGTGER